MMKAHSPTAKPHIYFIGIGGIGTSSLARYFLSCGYKVSGSDSSKSDITKDLVRAGIKVNIGQKASNMPSKGVSLVVYTAAVPKDNPEFKAAKKAGFKTLMYAEALGNVSKQHQTIAVAGAHGKSTTTSLLSLILINGELDPTVIVGTKLKEFKNSNFRKGKSNYFVIEADEYNRHLLNYSPAYGIIANIDREHLDIYKDLNDIKRTFLKYISGFQKNSVLVLNTDDKNLYSLKTKIAKIARTKKIKLVWYSLGNKFNSEIKKIKSVIKLPGDHNLSNALSAYLLARELGIKEKDILSAISKFNGCWRRMEFKGKFIIHNSSFIIHVYDDYAHHPTEIKAALSGMKKFFPNKYLICVFEPHQTARLKKLFKEFSECFGSADLLILLDIYKVKGRESVKEEVNSQKLAFAVGAKLKKEENLKEVRFIPHSTKTLQELKKKIISSIKESGKKEAVVIMMGAGDIYKMTSHFVKTKSVKRKV